jgi:hypothetical protein
MRRKAFLLLVFLIFCLGSCSLKKIAELVLQTRASQRKEQNEEKLTFEEASRRIEMYWAITIKDVGKVKQYLEEGYDPNRCMGEEGWMVKTPLNIIARSSYSADTRLEGGEEIPTPSRGVAMLQLLVEAGADVNRRPYIWCRVYTWNNWDVEQAVRRETSGFNKEDDKKIESKEVVKSFVDDVNSVLEAFLKAGADPDKLGHPYPYSLEAKYNKITDEEADKYFAKGTRPINEAIKKGIRWESQVDLLLQYTKLDEDSLKAAKESKDPAMVEKITKLWKEQQGKNGR